MCPNKRKKDDLSTPTQTPRVDKEGQAMRRFLTPSVRCQQTFSLQGLFIAEEDTFKVAKETERHIPALL